MFLHDNNKSQRIHNFSIEDEEEFITPQETLIEEFSDEEETLTESLHVRHHKSPIVSDFQTEINETEFQEQEDADSVPDFVPDSVQDSVPIQNRTTSHVSMNLYKSDDIVESNKNYDGINFTSYIHLYYTRFKIRVELRSRNDFCDYGQVL